MSPGPVREPTWGPGAGYPLSWWAPPLRDMTTGHRVAGAPGVRPMQTRDLPGADVLALMPWWRRGRVRLVFWVAELAMRAAAREMGHLPPRCHDQVEPLPRYAEGPR